MHLKTFLHQLQYEPEKTKPQDQEIDWEHAPLPYKLYRHLPVFPLGADIPLTLEGYQSKGMRTLQEVGYFLWYSFGLTQLSQTAIDSQYADESQDSVQHCRRFVPSGGGLYPSELYLYLKLEDLPNGIYHYDVAHHRLIQLREGEFDHYLGKALGDRCDLSNCFGVAFVSTMFWKNFYKYNNFSYRLQGLDAGLLMGQMLEAAKRFQIEAGVYYQFLDRAINRLLGLSEREESVYAVIPFAKDPLRFSENKAEKRMSSDELCNVLAPVEHVHFMRSDTVAEYPLLTQMNEASMMDYADMFKHVSTEKGNETITNKFVLPKTMRLTYDFAAVCRQRFSPENEYLWQAVTQSQLASLLHEVMTSFTYRNDLDDGLCSHSNSRIFLYVCLYGIEGIQDGAYRYNDAEHVLEQVRTGDLREWLQHGMSLDNVNLYQVPLCFHVAGEIDHLHTQLGYRGYRIQQMEAGLLVQRLLLAASASNMEGRPLLGFDASIINHIYGIEADGKTSLIQIPIGACRARSRLQGSLAQ